jgi:hypothetical protein
MLAGSERDMQPRTMAGYSAKPLWPKLGFKPDTEVVLIGAPDDWSLPGAPTELQLAREAGAARASAPADSVIAFFPALAALREQLPRIAKRVFPDGALWIAWPRRAGGHESDIREQDIRDLALPLGLVDVKVAALDDHWSGLRLVWRVERRAAGRPGRR